MTLILTFLSELYIVQASDRRITYSDGRVSEVMNKSVVIGTEGCAAYTGLAFLDGRHPTDITLIESIADSFKSGQNALERLARDSSRAVRMNRALPRDSVKRGSIARTSFVVARFAQPAPNDKIPLIHVISNAQSDLGEAWASMAHKSFRLVSAGVRRGTYLLHAADQPVPPSVRAALWRSVSRAFRRCDEPEAVARLLARTIQDVSSTNPTVGPNVNVVMVRPIEPPPDEDGERSIPASGLIPIGERANREAEFFRGPGGDVIQEPIGIAYLPDPSEPQVFYGPSQVHPEFSMHSPVLAPAPIHSVITKALDDLRAGRPTDLALPAQFRRRPEPRTLP